MSAPHVPLTNALLSTTPLRMPYGWSVISPYPSAKLIGAWMIVAPAARASSATCFAFSSMLVDSITSSTAPWRAPPSDVKSFWNSIKTTAVCSGSVGMA